MYLFIFIKNYIYNLLYRLYNKIKLELNSFDYFFYGKIVIIFKILLNNQIKLILSKCMT